MSILYIMLGERCNTRGSKFTRPATDHEGKVALENRVYGDPERYWAFQRHVGAFTDRQKRMLLDILPPRDHEDDGVWWMNLCLPHPTPGTWTLKEAARAADCFMAEVPICTKARDHHILVCCCGTRIARALERKGQWRRYPERYGEIADGSGLHWTRLPHPSGRNRAWNDPSMADAARQTLRNEIDAKLNPRACTSEI